MGWNSETFTFFFPIPPFSAAPTWGSGFLLQVDKSCRAKSRKQEEEGAADKERSELPQVLSEAHKMPRR